MENEGLVLDMTGSNTVEVFSTNSVIRAGRSIEDDVDDLAEERIAKEPVDKLTDEIVEGWRYEPPVVHTSEEERDDLDDSTLLVKFAASGDLTLLKEQPTGFTPPEEFQPFECEYTEDELWFTIDIDEYPAGKIEEIIKRRKGVLKEYVPELTEKYERKNEKLRRNAREAVEKRQEVLNERENKMGELLDKDE